MSRFLGGSCPTSWASFTRRATIYRIFRWPHSASGRFIVQSHQKADNLGRHQCVRSGAVTGRAGVSGRTSFRSPSPAGYVMVAMFTTRP